CSLQHFRLHGHRDVRGGLRPRQRRRRREDRLLPEHHLLVHPAPRHPHRQPAGRALRHDDRQDGSEHVLHRGHHAGGAGDVRRSPQSHPLPQLHAAVVPHRRRRLPAVLDDVWGGVRLRDRR
ncbi:Uncharacterized protein DAT39_022443, partial [Clarias magur]